MPPPVPSEPSDRDHLYHDLRTTLTHLRLRTQLLHRLAREHDGPAWLRMADGLAAIDAGISTLLRQVEDDERR